jgi:hypothetical protein
MGYDFPPSFLLLAGSNEDLKATVFMVFSFSVNGREQTLNKRGVTLMFVSVGVLTLCE